MLRNTINISLLCSLLSVACDDDDISFRAGADETGGAGSSGDSDTSYPTACGDGMIDFEEECDDGNMVNDDSCTNMCTFPPAPPACDPLGNPAASDVGESQWVSTQDHVVQTFTTCGESLSLRFVDLPLRTCSANGQVALTLELRPLKIDGTPSDSVLGASYPISSTNVISNCGVGPHPFGDVRFKFSEDLLLNAETKYALVLKASPVAPATNSYGSVDWQRNYNFNPNPYALGTYWHRFQWGNVVTPWVGNSNYDLNFRLLGNGAPTPNSSPQAQAVDVFGSLGVHYWFAVDPAEVTRMNQYWQTWANGNETYADHMFVSTPGGSPQIADYGKVEVRVVGQSTYAPWHDNTKPNLKVDTDQFTNGLKVGGVEHLRFNNGSIGTIFRERLALAMYEQLNYPAPRATYAWVGSNVWGPEIELPYTLVEAYKRDFCKARSAQLGGGCNNIWEFVGDFGDGIFADPESCQLSSCNNTRVLAFEAAVLANPGGQGFKAALASYVDWDAFHRFQCISWLLWTGDDALHNVNNVVLLERKDGRFQYLPYSVDISAGQSWYQNTPLTGLNSLANGCQSDPACWTDTISECEDVVAEFVASQPALRVDQVHAELAGEGMLRDGDEGYYMEIREWYKQRALHALEDLDNFRTL